MATHGGGPSAPASRGRLLAYSIASLCVFLLCWELLPRYVLPGTWANAIRPLSQVLEAGSALIADGIVPMNRRLGTLLPLVLRALSAFHKPEKSWCSG